MMEGRIASGADSVPTNLAFVREGDYIRMIGMPMGRVIGRATVGRGIAGFRVRLVNGSTG